LGGGRAHGPFGHVFIIVEENANYSDVIGDSSMPYLNSLARQYGLATQYYGNAHPSIGNYFMMTVGDTITNDDGYSGVVSEDNVVRALVAGGKTWKAYAEDLPCVGYRGAGVGRYARKHNVFALFSDVVHDTAQAKNLVPFTQLTTDLATRSLPDYAFIIPNLCNDAHDCPLRTADAWLKTNIDPLVQSATFQQWLVDHRVRRSGPPRLHERRRSHPLRGREPEGETRLPVDRRVSAPEPPAVVAPGGRREDVPQGRSKRAGHGGVFRGRTPREQVGLAFLRAAPHAQLHVLRIPSA